MLLSRVHALESHFNDSGALIIGVQEGRVKEEQLRAGVCYQMVVAPSENGSYEVQAWFHKIPWTRVSCCQRGQPKKIYHISDVLRNSLPTEYPRAVRSITLPRKLMLSPVFSILPVILIKNLF